MADTYTVTLADRRREAELFRFYSPEVVSNAPSCRPILPLPQVANAPLTSPDTTLTSLCQLVCLRLNAATTLIRYVEEPAERRTG